MIFRIPGRRSPDLKPAGSNAATRASGDVPLCLLGKCSRSPKRIGLCCLILLAFGAIALVLWIGGRDVLAGRISAGDLSAFVFYAVVVAMAVGTLSEVWGDVSSA